MRNKTIFATAFIIMFMILVLAHNKPSISGFATEVITSSEAQFREGIYSTVNAISLDESLKYLGEGADVCMIVETNKTTYAYQLLQKGDSVLVNEGYCGDLGENNVIIKFNSYEELLSAKARPRRFMFEQQNIGYYIFPSNYVMRGGEIQCSAEFQDKYCVAASLYLSSSEMKRIGLGCCAGVVPKTPSGMAYYYRAAFVREGWIYVIILFVIIMSLVFLSSYRKKSK